MFLNVKNNWKANLPVLITWQAFSKFKTKRVVQSTGIFSNYLLVIKIC